LQGLKQKPKVSHAHNDHKNAFADNASKAFHAKSQTNVKTWPFLGLLNYLKSIRLIHLEPKKC